jgi:hypothetical protein
MAYFLFSKNSDNISGSLYRIAKDQTYLNYITPFPELYKVIEDSIENFDSVVLQKKQVVSYNGNTINYSQTDSINYSRQSLIDYINQVINQINNYLKVNLNSGLKNELNSYKNLLSSLNVNSIISLDEKGNPIPINKSLEQYLSDLGNEVINPLQIP